ncbi:MAG: CsiV family protein [Gammaproteobacteria bacterium]
MKNTSYLLGLFLAVSIQVHAATEDEIRYYDVEVVIFKNNLGPKGQEYILPNSSPRIDGEFLDLSSSASIEAAREKSYEIIPIEEMRLIETVLKIVNSTRYSLLAHVAWRQPGVEKDQAMPIWIKGGRIFGEEFTSIDNQIDIELAAKTEYLGSENTSDFSTIESPDTQDSEYESDTSLYELEGKITIGLSRYLHTYADLVLRKPRLTIDPSIEVPGLEQSVIENLPDTRILNNHSLKERRRMRSNKLHYLDNPEFSMLILITPYEAPEVDQTTSISPLDMLLARNEISDIHQ